MAADKIRYYRVRRNKKAFWEPTPSMRKLGFSNAPLGPHGVIAQQKAITLNHELDKARIVFKKTGETTTQCPYPSGSLGSVYWSYRQSEAFGRLAPKTRDDYTRAWRFLEPAFANIRITRITEALCEDFQIRMEQDRSQYERHRTIRILRKLLSLCVKRQWLPYNPATTLPNPMPAGRSEFWLAHEIATHIIDAHEAGFHGLSVGLRIMWDTLFSPTDVRTIKVGQIDGDMLFNSRNKTSAKGIWTLSGPTVKAIEEYKASLGATLLPDTFLIRMKKGGIYRTKDTFSKDFRAVRSISFEGDKRQMADYRRSGNFEAALGGASPEDRAAMLANTLDKDAFLDATYTPINRINADKIRGKREAGRAILLEQQRSSELERIRVIGGRNA